MDGVARIAGVLTILVYPGLYYPGPVLHHSCTTGYTTTVTTRGTAVSMASRCRAVQDGGVLGSGRPGKPG